MKIHLITFILLLFITSCQKLQNIDKNQEYFLPNNSDIPLFKDFKINKNKTLNFDSVSGNISNITYQSESKTEDITKYYEDNLKNLGWKIIDKKKDYLSFQRGFEIIKISYGREENILMVNFFIIKNNG